MKFVKPTRLHGRGNHGDDGDKDGGDDIDDGEHQVHLDIPNKKMHSLSTMMMGKLYSANRVSSPAC